MISISIAYATSERQVEIPLTVEPNCTAALAVRRSGILQKFPDIRLGEIKMGIYGKIVAHDAALKAGDRVEIYRPLAMDPKQARLLRAKAH